MSHCSEAPCAAVVGGEIMLFGVRVTVDPMRKSVSMNNLSEYEPVNRGGDPDININEAPKPTAAAYASADDSVPLPTNGNRERKRGVPWTEEEHKLFLIGLQKVGKGDWRGISRNFVKTRTSTQVASHAQKYFIRRGNSLKRRRRRSSLFDITTDSVDPMSIEGCNNHQESPPKEFSLSHVLFSTPTQSVLENNSFSLDLNQQVPTEPSLKLSLSSGMMQLGFKNADSVISVV